MENGSFEILIRQDGIGFDPGQIDPHNPDSRNTMDQDARQGIKKVIQGLFDWTPTRLIPLQKGEGASIALSKLESVISEFKPSLVIINPLS